MGTLKLHSNGPLYTNVVISTLAVVTFGTATGLGLPSVSTSFSMWHYNCLCSLMG